jgi:hypothetical protein
MYESVGLSKPLETKAVFVSAPSFSPVSTATVRAERCKGNPFLSLVYWRNIFPKGSLLIVSEANESSSCGKRLHSGSSKNQKEEEEKGTVLIG